MTDIAIDERPPRAGASGFLLSNRLRLFLGAAAALLTGLSLYAVTRWLFGFIGPDPHNFAVAFHIATVVPAIPLGAYVLLAPKGGLRHRLLGRFWLGLMTATAISTIFIRSFSGGFSPIHVFTVMTFIAIPGAIMSARSGNIDKHRKHMIGFYIGALILAGITAFTPGRTMWHWAFG
ncbi:MAG: DUF2306 domain-containing protein [Sphingomonas sp.]|nr:DUF2306 domain-containing protein [Sphingomonas sp.]